MDKLGGVTMDRRRLMMNDTIATLDGKPIITCKRSKGSKFANLKLFGKSEQFKTTGANLFNVDSKQSGFVSGIEIGDKVEVSQNASYPKAVYFDEITVDSTKKYSFCFWNGSTVLSNDNVRIRIYNDNNVVTEIPAKNNVVNKKFADGTTKVRVLILDEFPNLVGMFCEGSTLKAYEPYTGGQPSPSPDYPQEIKSVVNSTMKVYGKNLWDNFKTLSLGNVKQENGTYIATTGVMQVDITPDSVGDRPLLLKANNAYTFSLKTTVSISRPRFICLKYTNGKSHNFIFVNQNFVNFVPKRDVEKVGFVLYDSVAGDKAYDAQLEMGSEATPYEPYHEQTVTLPYTLNAIPVSSGGNYTDENGQQWICDEVNLERGVYVQRVKVKELSHDAKWVYRKLASGNNNFQMRIYGEDASKNSFPSICNILPYKNVIWNDNIQNLPKIYANGQEITASFPPSSEYSSLEAFKQLLMNVKSFIFYCIATPIETPLTPDEIAVYKTLHTYTGIANISNDAEAWMQVGYRKVR